MIKVSVPTAGVFPDSKTAKAYPANSIVDRTKAPPSSATATSEGTTTSGAVSLTLLENAEYWIGCEIAASEWRYMHVTAAGVDAGGFSTVSSANTMTLPSGSMVEVTGTTEIKKIEAGAAGRRVTLLFKEAVKLVKGENLKIASTFEATADDTFTLVSNGTNWYEAGRAVN